MVIAEIIIKDLDRFRGDVDAVFNIRGNRVIDWRDAKALEAGVDLAYRSSAAFHARIILFGLEIRQNRQNAVIDASEFEELDDAVGYLFNIWLVHTQQLLAVSDAKSVKDDRLDELRSNVAEMVSILRSREVTKANVDQPQVVLNNASASEEQELEAAREFERIMPSMSELEGILTPIENWPR